MFLRAGLLSLTLLLASRVLGLAREAAQAAAFGASGVGDVATLMLSLPDWIAGVLAGGALAYVLLPAWAGRRPAEVAAMQRRVAGVLLAGGTVLAAGLAWGREPALALLAPGLPPGLRGEAAQALPWSALAVPLALLAALWTTRLQHEGDFLGLYAASLVVNGVLIGALVAAAAVTGSPSAAGGGGLPALVVLGAGLLLAMAARLAWLRWRQARWAAPLRGGETPSTDAAAPDLPHFSLWAWAAVTAGLPLALPFAARSLASGQGEGALVIFNFAWKLLELPLLLAVQLVGVLALGPIARALAATPEVSGAQPPAADAGIPIRRGFALAFTLACACAAALLVAAPSLARLLFGWGRMDGAALAHIAQWGRAGAWSLLPQALLAIGVAVLAARRRLQPAAVAYGAALAVLLVAGARDGLELMHWLNGLLAAVAAVVLWAAREDLRGRLPWATFGVALAALLACSELARRLLPGADAGWPQLAAGVFAAVAVLAVTYAASVDLRSAMRR